MEWIDAVRGSTVGLDTGPLIYYIEEHSAFLVKIKPFFEAAERNEFRIVTSFVTLLEVLVHPLRPSATLRLGFNGSRLPFHPIDF